MLKPGELLKTDEESIAVPGGTVLRPTECIGIVLRYDGEEGCIIRRANGKEERWNKRTDEQPGFYAQEVDTVADMIDALNCLPADALVMVTDGDRQNSPFIFLRKNAAHSSDGDSDVVQIEAQP